MSDRWFAFVSNDGTVVGIGKSQSMDVRDAAGVALGLLERPTDLVTWMKTLSRHADPRDAAREVIRTLGGVLIHKPVNLNDATVLPLVTAASTAAEA